MGEGDAPLTTLLADGSAAIMTPDGDSNASTEAEDRIRAYWAKCVVVDFEVSKHSPFLSIEGSECLPPATADNLANMTYHNTQPLSPTLCTRMTPEQRHRRDRSSIALLVLLYTLQGVPMCVRRLLRRCRACLTLLSCKKQGTVCQHPADPAGQGAGLLQAGAVQLCDLAICAEAAVGTHCGRAVLEKGKFVL